MANKEKNNIKVSFSAIDPFIQDNIVTGEEKKVQGQKFINWGKKNEYPNYLFDLYKTTPTLSSIINGMCDFIVGDGVNSDEIIFTEEELEDIVRDMAFSYSVYGGIAINILRNKFGKVAKVIVLDFRDVRSDEKNEMFYYSPDFHNNKSAGRCKCIELPAFCPDKKDNSSVLYFKNVRHQTYPLPIYNSATRAAEIEKNIQDFQLNETINGFASNIILSFCNGIPSDEAKEDIEDAIDEKFNGFQNAGRPLINYCNDKDHSLEVQKIDTEGFIDKYNSAAKKAQQDLFTAFRAHPSLFGIPTEGSSLNTEDYSQVFSLFNRTMVRPAQKIICNIFDKIFSKQGTLRIKPFSIDFSEDAENNETVK